MRPSRSKVTRTADGDRFATARLDLNGGVFNAKATVPNFTHRIAFNISRAAQRDSQSIARQFLPGSKRSGRGVDSGAAGEIAMRQAFINQSRVRAVRPNQENRERNCRDGANDRRNSDACDEAPAGCESVWLWLFAAAEARRLKKKICGFASVARIFPSAAAKPPRQALSDPSVQSVSSRKR